jgi:hypothetical protein
MVQQLVAYSILAVFWLAPPLAAAWLFKRKGYSANWAWSAVVPIVGLVVVCIPLLLADRTAPAPDSAPASATATQPRAANSVTPAFVPLWAALVGAVLASWSMDGVFSFTAFSASAIIGGCIGLLAGLLLQWDDWAVQRRLNNMQQSTAPGDEVAVQPAAEPGWSSNAIAALMLALPLAAGLLNMQQEAMHLSDRAVRLLCVLTVISTALLGYCDMRLLVLRNPNVRLPGKQPLSPPIAAFAGILGVWVIAYPGHFLFRSRLGARSLIVPALAATAVYFAPAVSAWFSGPALPSVGSPQVLALVSKSIGDTARYEAWKDKSGKLQIREPLELSFDRQKQRRVARAKLASELGEEDIFYTVEWQDRDKGMFMIQVYDHSPEERH